MFSVASAQIKPPPDVGLPTGELPVLILRVINASLALVAVIALGFIVYGGFLYVTARGDESQVSSAKTLLTYAIVGIIVVGLAAALVNFVVGGLVG